MSAFTLHTLESAPEAARPILEKSFQRLGFVPNLYAGLANAPAALEAYVAIADFFANTSLNPIEQQVVLLTTSVSNACEFCVAAHSMMAKMVGLPESEVMALRERRLPDNPQWAALALFTQTVVSERGWVANHPAFQQFLAAGYTSKQALEVILGITQKTLSNYANHLLKTPLNPAFECEKWVP